MPRMLMYPACLQEARYVLILLQIYIAYIHNESTFWQNCTRINGNVPTREEDEPI